MKKRALILLNTLCLTSAASAMTTPAEGTPEPTSTVTPTPSPHRIRKEIMPPPRKLPKPHNMEPPIAPLSDPQMNKHTPPQEPPVPGEVSSPDGNSN